LPGITKTLGPGGIVAQPASIITTDIVPAALFSFISPSLSSSAGWDRVRHYFHPSSRTGSNVRIIALGILAVVPIIGFRLIPLDIRLRLLRNNH